jgi:hypothetical protein
VNPCIVLLSNEAHISGINHTPVGVFAIFKDMPIDRTQAFILFLLICATLILVARPSLSHKKICPNSKKH